MNSTIEFLRRFFLVRKCAVCGAVLGDPGQENLCRRCGNAFAALKREKCGICGQEQSYCRCVRTALFDGIGAEKSVHLFRYKNEFSRKIVYSLKRNGKKSLIDLLAGELARTLLFCRGNTDLSRFAVTWVPRSAKNFRKYGFDQSALLAAGIAGELGLPLCGTLCHTGGKSQKKIAAPERLANAQSSYRTAQGEQISGKSLILVDDVLTTGSRE